MTDLAAPVRRAQGRGRPLGQLLGGAAVACCAVVYATGFSEGRATAIVTLVAAVGFFAAYFGLWFVLQQAADMPDSELDELEVAQRDRAYLYAYRGIGAVTALTVVLAITDDAQGIVTSWVGPWTALLLLSLVLPSVVLVHVQPAVDDDTAG